MWLMEYAFMWPGMHSNSKMFANIFQSILKHDDIVTAYTTEWEHYRLASYYSSLMCDYLNGHIIKVKDIGGIPGAERRQIVGDGRYRRQTIQAVSTILHFQYMIYQFCNIRNWRRFCWLCGLIFNSYTAVGSPYLERTCCIRYQDCSWKPLDASDIWVDL